MTVTNPDAPHVSPFADAPVIVWLRRDLRVGDNPALAAAAETGRPVVPVFVLDDDDAAGRPAGAASRWWLHHSLAALALDLADLGSCLILRSGPTAPELDRVIAETGAAAVYWNRRYDGAGVACDQSLKQTYAARGLDCQSFNGGLLYEPWEAKTRAGGWFKVYSRFRQGCLDLGPPPPSVATPGRLTPPKNWPAGERLADWRLTPTAPDWAGGFADRWSPGARGARERLDRFLAGGLGGYAADRDRPDLPATSGLSAHLAWGDIGPRQVWHAAQAAPARGHGAGRETFLKELMWREFAYHVMFHVPDMADRPMQEKFQAFPWVPDAGLLDAWRRGLTGYPLVDAGMRELWATGTMHNRLRMVAASFLVKHLMQPWQAGETWFWDTLVDADPAANPFNWQWVAGCGADAAPYFRIFNPVLQGEKFDPGGAYVRRWVPELAALPEKLIHKPWTAPPGPLAASGVVLGDTYPTPIVDHALARDRALAAFKSLRAA